MATAETLKNDTSAAALSAALQADTPAADDFSSMFDQFAKPEGAKAPEPASQVEKAAADTQDPAAAAAGQSQQAQDPPSEIEGAPGADGKKDGEPAPEGGKDPKATDQGNADPNARQPAPINPEQDEFLRRLADVVGQRPQPQQQDPRQQRQVEQQPLYSQAETQAIQTFYNDYPDQAQAVAALLKGMAVNVTAHVFQEFAKNVGPRLALLEQLADRVTLDGLSKNVPDYSDELVDKVAAWVKTQPAYLQAAYNNVMQQGSESDIIDLVSRYRSATGAVAQSNAGDNRTVTGGQQGDPAPASTEKKPAAELSPAAKKAAAALAPVNSKRSAPTQTDPVTFDDAFERFAKAS